MFNIQAINKEKTCLFFISSENVLENMFLVLFSLLLYAIIGKKGDRKGFKKTLLDFNLHRTI